MAKRRDNGGKRKTPRERVASPVPPGNQVMDRLVRALREETSIPPLLIPEVLDDILGLISSELEGVLPDPDVEVALSASHLREQMLDWGYRREDLSVQDVDRILGRLIREMTRLAPRSLP